MGEENGHRDDDLQKELEKLYGEKPAQPYPSSPEEDKKIQKETARKLAEEQGIELDDEGNG